MTPFVEPKNAACRAREAVHALRLFSLHPHSDWRWAWHRKRQASRSVHSTVRNALLGLAAVGLVNVVAALPASAAPNPRAGEAISAQCATCHGSNGVSVATNIPNLAGQRYGYLLNQMKAFKLGKRRTGVMIEIARPLSDEQMQDIAAYFSSIPTKMIMPTPPPTAECNSCHNKANGHSAAPTIPDLAGQRYIYLLGELRAFKAGTRKNAIMNALIRPLSEEQLKSIAAYYASMQVSVVRKSR